MLSQHDQSTSQISSPKVNGRALKIIFSSDHGVKLRAENLVRGWDYGGNLELGDKNRTQHRSSCSKNLKPGPTSQKKSILATEEDFGPRTSQEIPEQS